MGKRATEVFPKLVVTSQDFRLESLVRGCVSETLKMAGVKLAAAPAAAAERNSDLSSLVIAMSRSVLTLALQSSNGDSPLVD